MKELHRHSVAFAERTVAPGVDHLKTVAGIPESAGDEAAVPDHRYTLDPVGTSRRDFDHGLARLQNGCGATAVGLQVTWTREAT